MDMHFCYNIELENYDSKVRKLASGSKFRKTKKVNLSLNKYNTRSTMKTGGKEDMLNVTHHFT